MEDRNQRMDNYNSLGHLVTSQCQAGFERAILRAELDEDWADLNLTCVMPGNEPIEADIRGIVMADIHEYLDGIREEMARQTGHRWNSCVFTVEADGHFKLDVQY